MRCRVFSYQLCIMNCVNRVKHVWWIAAKPSVGNIRVIRIAAVRSGMWAVNSYHAELFHRIPNIYSHFESHRGFGLTQIHGINSGTTTNVTCPTQSIPFLLMLWRLKEPGQRQPWYWSLKPEHSVSSITSVKVIDWKTRSLLPIISV